MPNPGEFLSQTFKNMKSECGLPYQTVLGTKTAGLVAKSSFVYVPKLLLLL